MSVRHPTCNQASATLCQVGVLMWLACGLEIASASETGNSGVLKTWGARFEKEVLPLLSRNGRDGCVGCHTARNRSSLRLKGTTEDDFRMLWSDGFLIPDDPGGVLHLVSTPNPKTHMPPGKRPAWNDAEIALLRRFVTELNTNLTRS